MPMRSRYTGRLRQAGNMRVPLDAEGHGRYECRRREEASVTPLLRRWRAIKYLVKVNPRKYRLEWRNNKPFVFESVQLTDQFGITWNEWKEIA